VAMDEARRIYGTRSDLVLCETTDLTLEGADALVIVTEWNVFKSPDFSLIREKLSTPVIFDGRNIYDPESLKSLGFSYYGIGRGGN